MNNNKREQLLTLLKSELGEYTVHGNTNEVSFYCFACHHYKKKLAVNLENGNWHCWVCKSAGKSMYSLFKSVHADDSVFIQLKNITGKRQYTKKDKETEINYLELPDEFIPITEAKKTFELTNAVKYLKKRGITKEDIIKYNIGYCERGSYQNFIIIPSYDKNHKLNYFVARNYYDKGYKYKNPPLSKNQIIFENTLSFKLPLILVEGVFDAISVKRNAVPLLGKKLQTKLYEQIIKSNVKDVYIMLDLDAREEAIEIAGKLQKQHINTYVVDMGDEDPADLGFQRATEKIKNTELTDFGQLVKLQFR